jgi:hypothetical protein
LKLFLSFILLSTLGTLIGQPILSNHSSDIEIEKSELVANNKNILDNGLSPLPDEEPKMIKPIPLPKASPPMPEQMPNKPKYFSEKEKPVNTTRLELIQRSFDPNLIEFYTGKSMKFKENIMGNVPIGVYINGIKAHSGKQIFTIYSKTEPSKKQIIRAEIKENTLKIFVADGKSNTEYDHNLVYQTVTTEMPEKYEVFRNGKIEKSMELIYSIE